MEPSRPRYPCRWRGGPDAPASAAIYAPIVRDTCGISFELTRLHRHEEDALAADRGDNLARCPCLGWWPRIRRAPLPAMPMQKAGTVSGRPIGGRSTRHAYVRPDLRHTGVGKALYGRSAGKAGGAGVLSGFRRHRASERGQRGAARSLSASSISAPIVTWASKNGAWHDVGWWQRRLRPACASSAPPEPRAA